MPSWFDFDSLDVHDIDEDAESMGVSVDYVHWLISKEMKGGRFCGSHERSQISEQVRHAAGREGAVANDLMLDLAECSR
eukprot:754563-Hanusia_phi.AAC.5